VSLRPVAAALAPYDRPMHRMRTLRPTDGIRAFYDGRVDGYCFADGPNWVDDGALSLGICSYAVVDQGEALVFDTHVSIEHARHIRRALEADGVRKFTVVLSHWHLDHVAGTAAFADCEVIASRRTAELLVDNKAAIEQGRLVGPPGIDPLVLPTTVYDDHHDVNVGSLRVELIHVNVHSADATVAWLPADRVLLAGDTVEDTITYVTEPRALDAHLADLERLHRLAPNRVLPAHGDSAILARGGYSLDLIRATQHYIGVLQRCRHDTHLRNASLREVIAGPLEAGWVQYFSPYEAVHRKNLDCVVSRS
jgi:cyclase